MGSNLEIENFLVYCCKQETNSHYFKILDFNLKLKWTNEGDR